MYLYLFDSFLGKKKYKKILDKIETRITDLEISGRIIRLTILENIEEIIKDAVKRGIETIIAVGNDKTFSQAATALVNSKAILGLIPIGEENKISKILGIPKEEFACDVISARLIESLDLGKINNHYFFSSVEIKSHQIVLENERWKINLSPQINKIKILNLDYYLDRIANPQDGFLEVVLEKERKNPFQIFSQKNEMIDSLFFLKKIKISSPKNKKGLPILVDSWRVLKTPSEIEILPQKINLIVGRKRKF